MLPRYPYLYLTQRPLSVSVFSSGSGSSSRNKIATPGVFSMLHIYVNIYMHSFRCCLDIYIYLTLRVEQVFTYSWDAATRI